MGCVPWPHDNKCENHKKLMLGENLYSEHTMGNISQGHGRDANIA